MTHLIHNFGQDLWYIPSNLMYIDRLLLDDGMQELHSAPFKRQPAMTNKGGPEQDAEGIQIRPVVLRNGLGSTSLLRGKITHSLFYFPLLPLGQISYLDNETTRAAQTLQRNGAVPKMGEADDTGMGIYMERVWADLTMDDASFVEGFEAVGCADSEFEKGGEVHDVPRFSAGGTLVFRLSIIGGDRGGVVLDLVDLDSTGAGGRRSTRGEEELPWGGGVLKEGIWVWGSL